MQNSRGGTSSPLVDLPEIGIMAGTRRMLGAGAGLLLADNVRKHRRGLGWTLLSIGTLTTIPFERKVIKD
jgi:hypothetical protein